MRPLVWTTEHESMLRKMWPHYSASEIVHHFEKLGGSFTRNAIIGKAHRLGLAHKDKIEPRPQGPHSLGAAAAPKKTGPQSQIRKPTSPPPKPVSDAPNISMVPFTPRIVDTVPLHLTLLHLTEATCKYECSGLDDPALFRFCGHPSNGTSYCEAHSRLCHSDLPKRKSPYYRAA